MLEAYRGSDAGAVPARRRGYGMNSGDEGFRMWSLADGSWNVSGVLDVLNAAKFRATLVCVARSASALRLTFAELRFIDLAGVQAIADVTEMIPGLSLTVATPSNSFRRCWRMLGYDETCPRVEIVG